MAYASPLFWIFLGLALVVFAALAPRLRPLWLLGTSLVFYGSFGWQNLLYLGFVCGVTLGALAGRDRVRAGTGRGWVSVGVVCLLASLVALKFGVLEVWGLRAPPGYSFYSFTAIAFLVDAGLRRSSDLRGIGALLALAWFPKLLAGPIERAGHLAPQISAGLRITPAATRIGAVLILGGLIKKLVIADNLALVVDAAYAIPAYAAPLELIIATYFFAFQIYCDFSGYSDIALGLSLLVGLKLTENFRKPYLSAGIGRFWAEGWHISLGRWFRDYVYFPLGGGRVGAARRVFNLLAVFGLSGLWHAGLGYGLGWGFLVWGLLNGVFVSLESALPAAPQNRAVTMLRVVLTFHLVLITWVFFRAAHVGDGMTVLRRIWAALPDLASIVGHYPFTTAHLSGAVLIAGLLGAEIASGHDPVHRRILALPTPLRWGALYGGCALLLLMGRWQGAGFIYMQF